MGSVSHSLQQFVEYQYAANTEIALSKFHTLNNFAAYTIHPDLLKFAVSERDSIVQILQAEIANASLSRQQGLIHLFLMHTQAYIYQNNQFILLSAEHRSELEQIYLDYLADMADMLAGCGEGNDLARELRSVITRHLCTLQVFISGLDAAHREAHEHLINTQVVCAEYSPSLQLNMLGINVAILVEPILDVGCGRNGRLVSYLRASGLEVYGVDRIVTSAAYLIEADWIQFTFDALAWGSIISHMAFSNHFLFHHQYRKGIPEIFAQKYMEMLRALKMGGTLYYAPSLPFIEQFLPPARFMIQRKSQAFASSTRIMKPA